MQSVDARILKTALWVITGCVTAGVLFHTAAHHAHPQIDQHVHRVHHLHHAHHAHPQMDQHVHRVHHLHHAHRAHFQMVPTAWRKSGTPLKPEMSQEFLFLFPSVARTVDTSKCNVTKVTTTLTTNVEQAPKTTLLKAPATVGASQRKGSLCQDRPFNIQRFYLSLKSAQCDQNL